MTELEPLYTSCFIEVLCVLGIIISYSESEEEEDCVIFFLLDPAAGPK